MSTRFTRMASNSVMFQVHVSDDCHFVLLPVLSNGVRVVGWLVYDTHTGEIITKDNDKPWDNLEQARGYIIGHYYRTAKTG